VTQQELAEEKPGHAFRTLFSMTEKDLHLVPGTLWTTLLERTADASRSGAIQSLPTTMEVIEQDGIPFQVRILQTTSTKARAKVSPSNVNPFLPYDPGLFVAPISPTHIVLLNKFNVVEHHLVIVTRTFEDQQSQLTQQDCEALLIGLTEIDGLAFYNAGPDAGASQSHKHLQLVPFNPTIAPLPIDPLLLFPQADSMVGTVPGLPFRHVGAPMDPDWTNPEKHSGASLHASYRKLLRAAGLSVDPTAGSHMPTAPYNLLMTRKWILLMPRSQECFEGISINALGFAGMLLVNNEQQLATLRRFGPVTALQKVTDPF
jgi:sulfate adenylyltransferase (ADP) / ATP adenylyltransferase